MHSVEQNITGERDNVEEIHSNVLLCLCRRLVWFLNLALGHELLYVVLV